ncbi:hypothetical protein, partial [Lactococcus petauri]|uniref:hypothetical protein n=1 Tax=Lactococcus petauri TaxID=1940789 RepID=UPI0021F10F09
MTGLIFLIVGFAAGLVVAYGALGLRTGKSDAPAPSPTPAPETTEPDAPAADPVSEALSAKLHRFSV